MSSIYQDAMGKEFDKLHPKIQERFAISSADNAAWRGTGVMEQLWHGPFFTYPFLCIGSFRRIMFPEQGQNVPFTIENFAYRDSLGRETVTWIRTFAAKRRRRFDAYMVRDPERGCIVDYLGTHQHLAVDIDLSVADNGGLRLRSGSQRFYEGLIAFRWPMLFSGVAEVCEWFDDEEQRFRISVAVSNSTFGRLFGYQGWFEVERLQVEGVPTHILPRREESRF